MVSISGAYHTLTRREPTATMAAVYPPVEGMSVTATSGPDESEGVRGSTVVVWHSFRQRNKWMTQEMDRCDVSRNWPCLRSGYVMHARRKQSLTLIRDLQVRYLPSRICLFGLIPNL